MAQDNNDATLFRFPKEVDHRGNVEYKVRLCNVTPDKIEHLRTQMKWRVQEGLGHAIYRIGIMDNGTVLGLCDEDLKETLEILNLVAQPLQFHVKIQDVFQGLNKDLKCATLFIGKNDKPAIGVKKEIRIVLVGPANAGKSSIAGVLAKGASDDGKGSAGRSVAVHKHEIRHGRTSSFSSHPLLNHSVSSSPPGVENVFGNFSLSTHDVDLPEKILSLMDTGGHPKSLTTSLRGVCGTRPDHFMIVLDVNTILLDEGKDNLDIAACFVRIAQSMQRPFFFVVTKVEDVDENDRMRLTDKLETLAGTQCASYRNTSSESSKSLRMASEVPIFYFLVSTVTGTGMDWLRRYLDDLGLSEPDREDQIPVTTNQGGESLMGIVRQFVLTEELFDGDDDNFVGSYPASPEPSTSNRIIVVGVVESGSLFVNQSVFVGPDPLTSTFSMARIVSMRCTTDMPVFVARKSTSVSICLEFEQLTIIPKLRGCVVSDRLISPERLGRRFKVEFPIQANEPFPRVNEEVVAFAGVICQTAKVISVVSKGESATIEFRFARKPEFFLPSTRVISIKRGVKQILVGSLMDIKNEQIDENLIS